MLNFINQKEILSNMKISTTHYGDFYQSPGDVCSQYADLYNLYRGISTNQIEVLHIRIILQITREMYTVQFVHFYYLHRSIAQYTDLYQSQAVRHRYCTVRTFLPNTRKMYTA
jgi:hypothetical protein